MKQNNKRQTFSIVHAPTCDYDISCGVERSLESTFEGQLQPLVVWQGPPVHTKVQEGFSVVLPRPSKEKNNTGNRRQTRV